MSNRFFSISNLAVAAHTPETERLWLSVPFNKRSEFGRQCVISMANEYGFSFRNGNSLTVAIDAFNHLMTEFQLVPKSIILRKAITDYSESIIADYQK